jgi:PTS system mannose-specific IIB component
MAVVFARVDDRLVHGQVVQGWVPFVHADSIYVVNNDIFLDEDRCRLMRMILPPELAFRVVPIDDLGPCLHNDNQKKIFLLFSSLEDVLKAVQEGVSLQNINVGNLHHQRGGCEVSPSVFLNKSDIRILRELLALGIDVEVKDVPEGRFYDFYQLLGEGDIAR